MLQDEDRAVDGDDVVTGKGQTELACSLKVEGWLAVGGVEYCLIGDEEVGVGGGEALSFVIVDGSGHGERNETIGLSVCGAEGGQFGFHGSKVFVVGIGWVVASDVGNGVIRTEACQRVDMPIGIVAFEMSVVEPQHAIGSQPAFQFILNLLLAHGFVPVGCQQTGDGGEYGSASVALDASAFEHEVEMVFIMVAVAEESFRPLFPYGLVDLVVVVGGELHSPTVELEIEHQAMLLSIGTLFQAGNEGMVACPCVVGGATYLIIFICRQVAALRGCHDE